MNENLKCIEIRWDILGATLANLSDKEQSIFFANFAREVNNYPTVYQRDMQLTSIASLLQKKELEVYEYLGYKEVESCKK